MLTTMTGEGTTSGRMAGWVWLLSAGLLALAAVLMWAAWNHAPGINCNRIGDPGYQRPLATGDYLVFASLACALAGSVVFAVGQWRAGHPTRGVLLALIPVPADLAFAVLWGIVVAYQSFGCS
jgi:hypothetical protein